MTAPALNIHVTDRQLSALSKGIHVNEIRGAIGELEAACNRKIEAAEDYSNVVKLVALKAGVDASVLAAYITARCNDTLAKKEKQAEQLSLLFSEIA